MRLPTAYATKNKAVTVVSVGTTESVSVAKRRGRAALRVGVCVLLVLPETLELRSETQLMAPIVAYSHLQMCGK